MPVVSMGLKVRQPGPNGEAVAVTMGTGSPWDRTKADIMPAHAGGYVTDLAVGGSFTVGASATGGTATQQKNLVVWCLGHFHFSVLHHPAHAPLDKLF